MEAIWADEVTNVHMENMIRRVANPNQQRNVREGRSAPAVPRSGSIRHQPQWTLKEDRSKPSLDNDVLVSKQEVQML